MTIMLTIVNVEPPQRGTPAFYRSEKNHIRIGRGPQLDWTLPDPTRHVSAHHCDILFEAGRYLLVDRSTNGVFLNGSERRVEGPQRLSDGDRLNIGPYLVEIAITDGENQIAGTGEVTARFEPAATVATDRRATPATDVASTQRMPGSFRKAFCEGAGITPQALANVSDEAAARQAGQIARIAVESLRDLLEARAIAKSMTGSTNRTVIGEAGNNPIKHFSVASEALETMLEHKPGYLDATESIAEAFADLRRHEIATYHAMQRALARLLDEIDPATIEEKVVPSPFSPKKARAWDLLLRRWASLSEGENGMLDTFLAYFAEAYDKEAGRK